ncbi:unnamed protein product [Paramecium primaurelia]|uniref:Uncharacterized protein n=1 Tax=Paramecium primaurelia TaxID=5886 RepID=A0A8S1NFI5_PARPR|nr:unnamed protein product [Paramecium primaurelia]
MCYSIETKLIIKFKRELLKISIIYYIDMYQISIRDDRKIINGLDRAFRKKVVMNLIYIKDCQVDQLKIKYNLVRQYKIFIKNILTYNN